VNYSKSFEFHVIIILIIIQWIDFIKTRFSDSLTITTISRIKCLEQYHKDQDTLRST